MLLIILLAFVLISFVLMFICKTKKHVLIHLTCLFLADFLFWVLVYISKKGGISEPISVVFFLSRTWRTKLQYMMVTLQQMSIGASIGRYGFPLLLLWTTLSVCESMRPKVKRVIALAGVILPALYICLYIPNVFEQLISRGAIWKSLLIDGSRTMVIAYVLFSMLLLVVEFVRRRILYFRLRFVGKYAFLPCLATLYLMYCMQDPGQIYLFYRDENMMDLGLWYLQPAIINFTLQTVLLSLIVVFSAIGFFLLSGITIRNYKESRRRYVLNSKSEIAKVGGSIFVHSMKNQILSAQVFDRTIAAELADAQPDIEKLRAQTEELAHVHTRMREHMDTLYHILLSDPHAKPQPVMTGEWLQDCAKVFRGKHPRADLRLQCSEAAKHSIIRMNEVTMREAVLNLLENALEAAGVEKPLDLCADIQQGHVLVQVIDRGMGIPRRKMRHIFEPFFSEKNTNSNWGMGLFYTMRAVHAHGGSIHVESKAGKGTTFYILLPRWEGKEKQRDAK